MYSDAREVDRLFVELTANVSADSAVMSYCGCRERKCADTIGTVPVPWAGHFQCKNIFLTKIYEQFYQTALGNCYSLKLPKMQIAV